MLAVIKSNPKRTGAALFALFCSLALLALVLDIALSSVRELKVESVSLDASQLIPVADAEVTFRYGTRLSRVELEHIRCSLEQSGDIEVMVNKSQLDSSAFIFHATCPHQHVDAHAALIWDTIVSKKNPGTVAFKCSVVIRVLVANIFPMRHTVDISSETLFPGKGGDEEKETEEYQGKMSDEDRNSLNLIGQTDSPRNDESQTGKRDTADVRQNNGNDPDSSNLTLQINSQRDGNQEENKREYYSGNDKNHDRDPSSLVRQVGAERLELGYLIELPDLKSSAIDVPTIFVKLPGLTIDVQPSDRDGMIISMDSVDATFLPHEVNQHNEVVFAIESNSPDLSWFGPILQMSSSGNDYVLNVTVDAGGSFLETVLGQHHNFSVHFEQQTLERTHRFLSTESNGQDTPAECMKVDDGDSSLFDFAMCLLIEPAKGVTWISNITLFDTDASGFAEVMWNVSSSTLQVDTKAVLGLYDDSTNDDVLNINGDMFYDWESLELDISFANEGSWSPFKATLLGNSSSAEEALRLILQEATFTVGDDVMVNAVGELQLEQGELTRIDAFLVDNGSWQPFKAVMIGNGSFEDDLFDVNIQEASVLVQEDQLARIVGDVHLNLTDRIQLETSFVNDGSRFPFQTSMICDGSFEQDIFNMIVTEAVLSVRDDVVTNATATFEVNFGESTLTAIITDPMLQFNIEGTVDEESLTGTSNCTLAGENLWNAVVDGRTTAENGVNVFTGFIADPNLQLNVEGTQQNAFDSASSTSRDVLTGASTFTFRGEDVWKSEANIWLQTMENNNTQSISVDVKEAVWDWEIDTSGELIESDDGALTVVVEHLTFQLEKETYVDTNGWLNISMDESTAQLHLEDNAHLDFVADAATGWFSNADDGAVSVAVEHLTFQLGQESFVDTNGWLNISVDESKAQLHLEDNAELDFVADAATRWFSNADDGALSVAVEHLTLQLEQETYVDTNGWFNISMDESTAQLRLEDNADLDFVADIATSWFSNSSAIGGQLDKAILLVGSEMYVDVKVGTFRAEEAGGSLLLLSSPSAALQVGADIVYDLGGSLVLSWEQVLVQWRNERLSDMEGRIALNLGDESSQLSFAAEDSAMLDFALNSTCRWSLQSGSVKGYLDEIRLQVGSETYVDSSGAFEFLEDDDANYVGTLNATSNPVANLQFRMEADFHWSETGGYSETVIDGVHVGWKNMTYMTTFQDDFAPRGK